jgi:rhamnogalacturonan endolyase
MSKTFIGNRPKFWPGILLGSLLGIFSTSTQAAKIVEDLDRGLVVIPATQGNAISWRVNVNDPATKGFDIYRNGKKINKKPYKDGSFFVDTTGKTSDRYQVALENEPHHHLPAAVSWNAPYLSIPLNKPKNDSIKGAEYSYSANDASVADLDGDGRYEIILKWSPSNAKDNSQAGYTGNVFVDAYTLEGKQLWRIDLGKNIRAGAHYTQFIAYDFNGDGRAEIAMKTADGSIDGRGTVIGNANADYRNSGGYILTGAEYLTMFDGLSGEALDTIDYVPARGNVNDWGDNYGNRVDRFLAGVAYFDGEKPSLLMARGYYTRAVVAAYDWVDNKFQQRWIFDTNNANGDEVVYGQGAHSLSVADVDADGRDEIIYGAATIDDNGHALYSTTLGHGDALHVSDLDPARPGMEIFMVHECPSCYTKNGVEYGVEMHDAATGQILWNRPSNAADVGRGVSIDIDPNFVGNEQWASRGGLVAANGQVISETPPPKMNFASWWDGDLLREMLDDNGIYKWDFVNQTSNKILDGSLFSALSNNGTKATPALSADIFGDWREEVIWRNADDTKLMIFSTNIPTQYRIPTLMQNPQYRTAIAWQNVGYNQPPHPDFYMGGITSAAPDYKALTNKGSEWVKLVAHGYNNKVVIRLYSHLLKIKNAEIFRSTTNDPSTKVSIGCISEFHPELVDTNVQPDVDYYYWAEIKGKHQNLDPGVSKTKLSISLIPQIEFNIMNNEVPVQLTWRPVNMDIRSISIYRAETLDANTPADFSASQLIANPAINSLSWADATATASKNYYYWIEFDNAVTNQIMRSEPAYVATVLTPVTNLVSTKTETGISLTWNLQNFPKTIRTVELYRNTANTATGRTRLASSVAQAGTFVDTSNLVTGTNYWYMFKLTFTDGTTGNTLPEAMITY